MRVFFILFGLFCISAFLSVTSLKEYSKKNKNKKKRRRRRRAAAGQVSGVAQQHQGTLSFFQNEIDRLAVTTSTMSVLIDSALKQQEQITRLEAVIATIQANSTSK